MKKTFYWSAICLLLSLVACQNTANQANETATEAATATPDLRQILNTQREQYLTFLGQKINSFPKDSIVVEQLLKDNSPAAMKLSQEIFRTFRADAMIKEKGEFKMQDFNDGTLPNINVKLLAQNDLPEINVQPFLWNSLEMKWNSSPKNWEPIYEWVHKTMDTKNAHQKQADGWRHSLHGFTQPTQKSDSSYHLILDAGTIDTDEIIHLLKIAQQQGIQQVTIGNDLK